MRPMKHGLLRRLLALTLPILAAAPLTGCLSGDPARVHPLTYRKLERNENLVYEGMRKKDTLALFKKANRVKLSEARIDGYRIQEWRADAVKGPSTERVMWTRFFYFANDRLLEVRPERWDYRGDPGLGDRLRSGPGSVATQEPNPPTAPAATHEPPSAPATP